MTTAKPIGKAIDKTIIDKLEPHLKPLLKRAGVEWKDASSLMNEITQEDLQACLQTGDISPITDKLASASVILAKQIAIAKLRPKLEPSLKEKGLVWEDALLVLDAITIELLQQCVKEESPEPIMKELAKASGPLLKKYLIGKLRPKLEPRLKEKGLVWEDAVPVLDAITVELLQQCVEEESPEPIMKELARAAAAACQSNTSSVGDQMRQAASP